MTSDSLDTPPNEPFEPYDSTTDPRLSPLEAELLNEYAKLRSNLDTLAAQLASLAAAPSTSIADGLRALERKTGLVHTALKSSVYGIVLQQQIDFQSENGEDGERSTVVRR